MTVVQAFAELGPWPVCASCGAQLEADGNGLLMAHADGCSQVASIAAQRGAGRKQLVTFR